MHAPRLIRPAEVYRDSFLSALREFKAEGRAQDVDHGLARRDFPAFVRGQLDPVLPPGWIPYSTYWLVDEGAYIGRVALRHALTERSRRAGGHIGYEIRPSRRRQGYGRAALRLGLPLAKAIGLDRVLVTCEATNVGSRRIIEANGGVLEDELEGKLRYWIAV